MPAPTIVFDLDGTLVDTAPDLIATLNVILARKGLAAIAARRLRNMIGGGARRLIERALAEQQVLVSPEELENLYADYIRYYAIHIADHSRPFSGLEPALDVLSTHGCVLAVCTNKLEWLSLRLLEQLGLRGRFAAICGQDTFRIHKPDPDMLRQTVARAKGRIDRAVMVGDSLADIRMARAAKVPVIAVDFGYTEVPVAQLQPDRVISRFDTLPAAVFALIGSPA